MKSLYSKFLKRVDSPNFYVKDLLSQTLASSGLPSRKSSTASSKESPSKCSKASVDRTSGTDEEMLTSIDQINNNYQQESSPDTHGEEDEDRLRVVDDESTFDHLMVGQEFTFRVVILQVIGIPKDYREVFCQFTFLHNYEPFSTEPIKNTGSGPAPGFYRIQNLSVTVTKCFIEYLRTQPLMFEVLGHFQQHPLDKESRDTKDLFIPGQPNNTSVNRQVPRRMKMPQEIPISAPVKSQKYLTSSCGMSASNSGTTIHLKTDVLIWFEICELAPSGDYIPVVVDHEDETPCRGTFLIHQGIQRRIRVTVMHESDPDIIWKEIRELVVGRIRSDAECPEDFEDDDDDSVLSLSLFSGEYLEEPVDDRTAYRFEAAWDTSLHSNLLLNRETPSGERVFLTLSAYLEMEKCVQPAVITKDICLIIYGRDARIFPRFAPNTKSLKQLLSGSYKSHSSNHLSSMYELCLMRTVDTGSPGVQRRQRRVLDTSGTYVRGEENLRGWQPKGDSLLFDHQWELEKITRIELVERMRHVLMVRDKLASGLNENREDLLIGLKASGSRMNLAALASPASPAVTPVVDESVYSQWDMSQRERDLCLKYVHLIQSHVSKVLNPNRDETKSRKSSQGLVNNPEVDVESVLSASSDNSSPDTIPAEAASWFKRRSAPELKGSSPSHLSLASAAAAGSHEPLKHGLKKVILSPELEEIRLSPIISKKGHLYLLDEKSQKMMKRWVTVKRPYLFVYRDEKDCVERYVINLSNSQIEYSTSGSDESSLDGHSSCRKEVKVFSILTKYRNYLFEASSVKDIHDWLYALNPLLAGEIISKSSRQTSSRKHDAPSTHHVSSTCVSASGSVVRISNFLQPSPSNSPIPNSSSI